MTIVVGTAGHIDHGKTTLLRALTGIDADRLPEEQRRGMTIDVGYAHMTLPDSREIDFVDVPGHDRLIGNMLVGAGEIDAVLLVVAADDGPRAQTIEHLELVGALGLRDGVVAITKTDLVDAARADEVDSDVRDLLRRTGLAGSPMVRVSGTSGDGMDSLLAALGHLAERVQASRSAVGREPGATRLAIDRVFLVKGRGVVVTGTLRGSIAHGDALRVVPGDRRVVVREVQVHGRAVDAAPSGRTALNVRGVGAAELRRGMVLTAENTVVSSDRLLVALHAPPALGQKAPGLPPDRTRLRLHLGTDQADARVVRAGREATMLADGQATAILRLDRAIAVAGGDRFVLRRPSTHATEAGGEVLDPLPAAGAARRRATPDRLAALAGAQSSSARDAALLELHGVRANGRAVAIAPDLAAQLRASALADTSRHHDHRPAEAGIPLATLRASLAGELRRAVSLPAQALNEVASSVISDLLAEGSLSASGDRIHAPDHQPTVSVALLAAMDRLTALLAVASPPPLSAAALTAGCPMEGVRTLERDGRIVRVEDDLAWAEEAYWSLGRLALGLATRSVLTPAALRDATGTSRKYVMAILEDLDRRGVLVRTPTGHVPGPRAAILGEVGGESHGFGAGAAAPVPGADERATTARR